MFNSTDTDIVGQTLCIFFTVANFMVILQYVIYAVKLRYAYGKLNKGKQQSGPN